MTSEAKPRIKITYATLTADNEDLHAGFEAAVGEVRSGLGAHHRNYVDGAWRDGASTFEVRSPIDRDIVLGTFASGTAADIDEAVAAARAAQPAWAATPWRERLAIMRKAGDLISDRLMELLGDHELRGRQEPDRIARRGRGIGRPHPLLRPDHGGQRRLRPRDGEPRRQRRPYPLDPAAAWRVRGRVPVQLPDGPRRRSDERRDDGRQHRRVQAELGVTAVGGEARRGVRRRRRAEGRHQPRHGPGRNGRPGAPGSPGRRRHRVHRLVRGRDAPVPLVLEGVAAPVHRRDGRQEPGHRHGQRRPRRGGRGDHALGVRVRRPEVLGQLARLRRPAGSTTTSSPGSSRSPSRSSSATRSSVPTGSARSSISAPSTATRRPSPRPAATARSSPGASTWATATWPAASTSSRPSSAGCRRTTGCSATSCSRR